LAISAGAALVAIVLLVLAGVLDLPLVVIVLGIVLLALAVALAGAAIVMTRRLRISVTLSPDSITVVRGRRTEAVVWSDVEEVALRGSRLTLVSKSGSENTALVNPRPAGDPTFMSLVVALQDRLNASRGYGGRPFAD
jgi:hypothetical protein